MRRPAQVGSWNDKRVTLDAGQAVNENVAVRLNAMYENSDTFRQYGHLERYGINPTVTLKPNDDTKIKLSYEFYHDFRLADRGNPSQGLAGAAGATRFNPTAPFAPNGNLSTSSSAARSTTMPRSKCRPPWPSSSMISATA